MYSLIVFPQTCEIRILTLITESLATTVPSFKKSNVIALFER